MHSVIKLIIAPLLRGLFVKKIEGIENLPKRGAYIVVINHSSYLDAFLAGLPILEATNRRIRFVTMKKYFYIPFTAPFIWWFGAIKPDGNAVETSVKLLRKGEIVGIFPEGGRTRNGKIQKIEHTGTAVIAILSGKPIVPVSIKGAYQVWSRHNHFPKFKKIIEIKIGKPIHFRHKKVPSKKMMLRELNKLMKIIEKMKNS